MKRLLAIAALLLSNASVTKAQESAWVIASIGKGYTMYARDVDGNAWNEPHWIQIQDSDWNQHLILVEGACSRSSVRVLGGNFVSRKGVARSWGSFTHGLFSGDAAVQAEIVANLVDLACTGWTHGKGAATPIAFGVSDKPARATIVLPVASAPSVSLGVVTSARSKPAGGLVIGVDARQGISQAATGFAEPGELKEGDSAAAICRDSYWSKSRSRTDACIRHGGVRYWLKTT